MSRPCLRPLIIEPKKPLKTEAESRFRAKLDAHDNPTITLIIEPNPTRDNVRRTGPAAAAGHVGRDPIEPRHQRILQCFRDVQLRERARKHVGVAANLEHRRAENFRLLSIISPPKKRGGLAACRTG